MVYLKKNLVNHFCKYHRILLLLKRSKTTSKFKVFNPCEKALSHFDDFYKSVFLRKWPSVRLGLLSKQKYLAVVNNFGDSERAEEFLQNQGTYNFRDFLEIQKTYIKQSDEENSVLENSSVGIEKIIEHQVQQKKELNAEMEVKSISNLLNDKKQDIMEKIPNPEIVRSSLHEDLLTSQIDLSRMIQPQEGVSQTSLHEFVPVTTLTGLDEYISESEYYKYYQMPTDTPITIEKEYNLEFPAKLKVYTFDRGDISEIPQPNKCIYDVYNYVNVEGSDLLTVLALGVQPEDKVLDMCSSSGSMAYCIFQTLKPEILVCCTTNKNTEKLFRKCLYNYSPFWKNMLMITDAELGNYEDNELFDRVLVSVPSTEDKCSIFKAENNIFHPKNKKQRISLPEKQCNLLLKSMTAVRPGGTILYSTATLSPVQNEGVISRALKIAWESSRMKFIVKDLTPALKHTSFFYNFGDYLDMKYGTLVVPFAPVNFGPKYFCKLVKQKAE